MEKCFITYNLDIKSNISYLIPFIEVYISSIESMVVTRNLMYNQNTINMRNERFLKIASKFSQH